MIDPTMSPWSDGSPRAVHLSSSDDPSSVPAALRRNVCIAVEIPDADVQPSTDWLRDNLGAVPASVLGDPMWGGDSSRWYVVTRPIPKTEWVAIWLNGQQLTEW